MKGKQDDCSNQTMYISCHFLFGGIPSAFFFPLGDQLGNVLVRESRAIMRREFFSCFLFFLVFFKFKTEGFL